MTVIDVTQRLDTDILNKLAADSATAMQPLVDSLVKRLNLVFVETVKVTASITVTYNTAANVIQNGISYGLDYGNKNAYDIDPFSMAHQMILNEGFARMIDSSRALR